MLALILSAAANPLGAQPEARAGITETTSVYASIGRIRWRLPDGVEHRATTRRYTRGSAIQCTGEHQQCGISVRVRAIATTPEERREALAEALAPFLEHSVEKTLRFSAYGTGQEVVYATLTDPRPDQRFRLQTVGYRLTGPAVIEFRYSANEAADVQRVLDVVRVADALDALEVWAWKLTDYGIVCEERFPAFKSANAAAFALSIFSSVDLVRFFQSVAPSATEAEVHEHMLEGRQSFAARFDSEPRVWRESFCRKFPTWVTKAANGIVVN